MWSRRRAGEAILLSAVDVETRDSLFDMAAKVVTHSLGGARGKNSEQASDPASSADQDTWFVTEMCRRALMPTAHPHALRCRVRDVRRFRKVCGNDDDGKARISLTRRSGT